jgi:hypothetical protein
MPSPASGEDRESQRTAREKHHFESDDALVGMIGVPIPVIILIYLLF